MKLTLSDQLLNTWEETYKKGQLTLWIFLSLRDGNKYTTEIKVYIEKRTLGTIVCEEQSLYRAMRKFQQVEMVDFYQGKGNSGPDRKYYYLTPMGEEILDRFIERNIKLFFTPEVMGLINK